MKAFRMTVETSGERAYPLTQEINEQLSASLGSKSGMVFIFCPHTSCGLCINESYDPSATLDLEEFLKHLAPRSLSFIKHDDEGPDDSPSHMKTLLSGSSLNIPVEDGKLMLGTWQGISLLEFRDQPKTRTIIIKFMPDR